jgi:hypothetical protein
MRLLSMMLLPWCAGACGPPVTYPARAEPFHRAVGCWELTSADADERVRARLLPGPVTVEFTPEPVTFLYHRRPERSRQIDFHLKVHRGLKGRLITTWTPISDDSVAFGWTFIAPYLSMVGAFSGDTVTGSGGMRFDVGGCCPFSFRGARVRCPR